MPFKNRDSFVGVGVPKHDLVSAESMSCDQVWAVFGENKVTDLGKKLGNTFVSVRGSF